MIEHRSFVGNVIEHFDLDHGLKNGLSGHRSHVWTDASCWLHELVGKRVRLTVEVVPDDTPEDPIDSVTTLEDLSAYPLDGLHLDARIGVKSIDRVYRLERLGRREIDGRIIVAAVRPMACWIEEVPWDDEDQALATADHLSPHPDDVE